MCNGKVYKAVNLFLVKDIDFFTVLFLFFCRPAHASVSEEAYILVCMRVVTHGHFVCRDFSLRGFAVAVSACAADDGWYGNGGTAQSEGLQKSAAGYVFVHG